MREFAKRRPWVFGIICGVVGVHVAVAISLACGEGKQVLYQPKKLVVHTKYLPKPTPARVVRQVAAAKVVKRVAKKPVPRQRKLLRDLEESIAKIEQKRDNKVPKKALEVPQKVDLSREVVDEVGDAYQDRLVEELRSQLTLPVFGNVTVQLRLSHSGAVLGVEVVRAESEENRDYLATKLHTITFPPFEGDLKQCDEQTFLLTFCSD